MPRAYSACLARVSGSKPPVTFLDELVDWALRAPDELFLPNAVLDAYSAVVRQLGPYGIGAHRKAVMLEVLRCLAGLETMWDWNHGVDGGKPQAKTSHNEEAGAFQVSATGDLANWHTGDPDAIPAVGGAMDLAIGARQVFVMMTLLAKDGTPKLVPECTYPLPGVGCVDRLYTDLAVFELGPDGAVVTETFGTSFDELADRLDVRLSRR